MHVPPPLHAGENEATGMFVGPVSVENYARCFTLGEARALLKNFLPAMQFLRQRRVDLPATGIIGVIPKPVVAMAVVQPPGMIENRVKANAVDGTAARDGSAGFAGHVAQPRGAPPVFRAGFSDEERPTNQVHHLYLQ